MSEQTATYSVEATTAPAATLDVYPGPSLGEFGRRYVVMCRHGGTEMEAGHAQREPVPAIARLVLAEHASARCRYGCVAELWGAFAPVMQPDEPDLMDLIQE